MRWVDACECSAHPFSWRWRCSTRVVGRSSSTSSHVANRPNPPQTCLGVEHIFVQRRSRGLQALRTLEAAAKGACRFTLPHQQLSRSQWRRRRARPLARRKHGNIVGEEVLQSRGRAGLAGRRVRQHCHRPHMRHEELRGACSVSGTRHGRSAGIIPSNHLQDDPWSQEPCRTRRQRARMSHHRKEVRTNPSAANG